MKNICFIIDSLSGGGAERVVLTRKIKFEDMNLAFKIF